MAQIDRGEGIPGDRLLEVLAQRRAAPVKSPGLMHFLVNAPDVPEE
jgi:hypothetical protein